MKWLSYPAFLLLRELGIAGMLRALLGIALAGGASTRVAPTLSAGPLQAVLVYLARRTNVGAMAPFADGIEQLTNLVRRVSEMAQQAQLQPR